MTSGTVASDSVTFTVGNADYIAYAGSPDRYINFSTRAATSTGSSGGGAASDGSVVVTESRFGGGSLALDGTADWGAVFAAAIAQLGSTGGRVVVPPGRYGLSAPLQVPGTVMLEGSAFGVFSVRGGRDSDARERPGRVADVDAGCERGRRDGKQWAWWSSRAPAYLPNVTLAAVMRV